MGNTYHHHSEEKKPLKWFASPLVEDHVKDDGEKEHQSPAITRENTQSVLDSEFHDPNAEAGLQLEVEVCTQELRDMPSFKRHAEATNQELFFDLFFVANLTTFTSLKEINDSASLRAYVGFFALLWLTWYSNSLYDVRFTADCIFERIAKALHFGVMVGFAVVGPAWEPGKPTSSLQKYQVLSFILMVSRLVLAAQYSVTLFFVRKHKKTVLPLSLVIGSTLIAALMYGSITGALPKETCNLELGVCKQFTTKVHYAWYIISAAEIVITVGISCYWRVISFKGTHIVQRMSLLTLIILGEGIIVVCKAISKIVKNGSQFDTQLTGQIVSSVLIIYLLYMLYFDRMHEEHFGTIKQQVWASLHFFLHIMLVLVLQGVSYLIMWVVALIRMDRVDEKFREIEGLSLTGAYANGTLFADALRRKIDVYLWNTIPKGVDASKALETWNSTLTVLAQSFDNHLTDEQNLTAVDMITKSLNTAESMAIQTLFDSLSISVPKTAPKTVEEPKRKFFDKAALLQKYETRFELVFDYVFLSAGLALTFMAIIAFVSLPPVKRHLRQYVRLLTIVLIGFAVCLICLINTSKPSQKHYMESNWMLPTICLLFFFCVLVSHLRPPARWRGIGGHHKWHGA
ncbi:hypothetical protein J4E83_004166 [Alternaria metachromatica]|uniref:uncharacterized protein n=1 Tax=Alternaria metachromatica TaxID=283354 RepID=UPI0020C2A60F|nr:uncharacterized protein J4E83_004166 [Alternaria metachromatica]KAI4624491.1 hypothetical protein J4E83_004166 [Alternaria metachromatica]